MNSTAPTLPSFATPPLEEVVIGMQFAPIAIKLAEIGAFHAMIEAEYPVSLDVPPLQPSFELLGGTPGQIVSIPGYAGALWRSWFISADDDHLVQLQPDRLLVNWRMRPAAGPYPRYQEVKRRFDAAAAVFHRFITRYGLTGVQANQCELSYINRIAVPAGASFAELGHFLTLCAGAAGTAPRPRFSAATLTLHSELRDHNNGAIARLVVECAPAVDARGQRAWGLNITVRGRPAGPDLAAVTAFMDRAHVEIVTCFADITTAAMQAEWGVVR